jgi:hypothetical protein
MVDQGKGAFFDQEQVDKWDARETGQALKPILAKIGRMNRTAATPIRSSRSSSAIPTRFPGSSICAS